MSNPNLANEVEAALATSQAETTQATQEQQEVITNENALIVLAQALVGIEKHLFALVYIENTRDPEKTGFGYVPEVFKAIYDGGDPFKEVKEAMDRAAAMEEGQA